MIISSKSRAFSQPRDASSSPKMPLPFARPSSDMLGSNLAAARLSPMIRRALVLSRRPSPRDRPSQKPRSSGGSLCARFRRLVRRSIRSAFVEVFRGRLPARPFPASLRFMARGAHCRICGHRGLPLETFEDVDCFRCAGCGTVQSFELPSDEELAFHSQGFSDRYTAGMGEARFRREMPKRHAAKLALVRRYVPRGRLLDVGSGEGFFLEQALAAGFDAIGCDASVRKKLPPGVRVLRGTFDAERGLPFEDASFDVVSSWAVIEHVRDPHAAMRE